jgi:hypothetical protein
MQIKIAIATNIKFYEKTLPVILDSLKKSGISNDMIYIFNSGFNEDKENIVDGITYLQISHCEFEYSPLVEIVEKQISSDYWFLIHDTCTVGLNFKEKLYNNVLPEKPVKVALTKWPSMSVGLYSYDYLLSVKDSLLNIKNTDYSDESMKKWKFWGVSNEDFILWQHQPHPALPKYPHEMQEMGYANWYGTDTLRKVEYFGGFDVYKNKSNWGQSSGYNMIIDL